MAISSANISAILRGIGAPVNPSTTQAMQEWEAAEGGSNNNWYNIQPGGQLASYTSPAAGVAATVAVLNQSNMAGIKNSLVQGLPPDQIQSAIIASPWSQNHYQGTTYGGGATDATLTSDVTTTTAGGAPAVPAQKDAPLVQGADVANFHGYDLSTIPSNQLGNAEQAILNYVANPNALDPNGLTLDARLQKDFGYTTKFIDLLPADQRSQVKATLIWASQYLDNSDAASVAQFDSAIAQTKWYQGTSQYQRAWENLLGSDPQTADKQLAVAQDKVLAVANQLGVTLTAAQLHQIANTYAAQSYQPSGTYSTLSGTSSEWLDQAVVSAVTAVGKGGQPSDLDAQAPTATSSGSLTGIASALYQQFQQVAQQYLMYNPTSPGTSLLKDSDLMAQVNSALQNYTGTGASGQISQFEAGALNTFTEQMKQKATQMYPSLAAAIAQGTTPSAYTAPEASLIANTLGLDSQSIDFTSPTWNWAIATPDPKTGVKTALTQDQILQKITNPSFTFQGPNGQQMSYDNTNNAVDNAKALTSSLSSMFGIGGV